MELSSPGGVGRLYSLTLLKSFSVWSLTLAVCGLVVGFPLVVLMATMGVLATVILQSVLPMSSVLLVAGSLIGGNILAVFVGAAVLTCKGIHPEEVSWLGWLRTQRNSEPEAIFASCPLTCSLVP